MSSIHTPTMVRQPRSSARRFMPSRRWASALLVAGALTSTGHAVAGKAKAGPQAKQAQSPAKGASAAESSSLELVSLEELNLGSGPSKGPPARRKDASAAPKDSLDGLLNHSTRSEPKAPPKPKERLAFPDEKVRAASPEKVEIVAPERVTSEVTAKALAAASADAAKHNKVVPASANVPKLPPKMKLNDDPLAGVSEKEQRSQRHSKVQKTGPKDGF